ncbi:MAG: c-type cytochrome [Pseudobdellovibrionaceae bacterium]|nr:c-type cytochrome [Bdellovibrionales bacterium]USN48323.1 MAG: c-type cytochrome [Pseudobdellovibrionaceae bacterium]
MSEDKTNIDEKLIAGHEYDGIKELDNPLPDWWLFIFYATIIFSAIYFFYYEMDGGGKSSDAILAEDMAVVQQQQAEAQSEVAAARAALPQKTDADLANLGLDTELMAKAGDSYDKNCKSCHGEQLQGGIGPNLTDKYWIHTGGTVTGIVNVIHKGVLEKGMPPWENIIPDAEIEGLAAYIYKMKGTNPPNAKKDEGTLFDNY